MASKKKKVGGKARATKRAKPARSTKKAKPARAMKKAKAAHSTRGAARQKPKAGARRATARAASAAAKQAPTRKRTPPTVEERQIAPPVINEVIEESLVDVSTILRIKDGVARSRRDIDEDESKQFADPSLVVEVQARGARRDESDWDFDADEASADLPGLFGAEARRQKATRADARQKKDGDSDADGDAFSEEGDED
jgi:hypothetical protein